jgi:Zn-dependent protease with chaperone function
MPTSGHQLVDQTVGQPLGTLLSPITLHWRVRRSVARATITLPAPESMRPLLARLGLQQLEVRLQPGPAVDRCHRLGRRAWIVLGEGAERTPTMARFVLWHEVAHLARRDIAARRLNTCLGYGLFVGALTSFDLWALAIAITATARLTVAGQWWSGAACDRFAVRQNGPESLHTWAEVVRGSLAALRLQRKLSRWARVKSLFTHPPLALRAALHPNTQASRQDQGAEHDQPATVQPERDTL